MAEPSKEARASLSHDRPRSSDEPPPPQYSASAEPKQEIPNEKSFEAGNNTEGFPPSNGFKVSRKPLSSRSKTPPESIEIIKAKPEDFEGELETNNDLPSYKTLKKIENYVVLDRDGKTHPFKSLYTGSNVARRVLIIFVRHFFCGNCQDFLRSLSEAITPEALLQLPVSTFIAVIGCGDQSLIDMYVRETGCPFPVYTDPTRSLFNALDMTKTLALGSKPAYMRNSLSRSIINSVVQGLKQIPSGNVLKMGDQRQVGGEFLFEPKELLTPMSTPRDQNFKRVGAFEEPNDGGYLGPSDNSAEEEKRVTWCHRMKTTRDHAEIEELMDVLGLDVGSSSGPDGHRASVASTRKGKGQSMAQEIRKLSVERSRTMEN